MIEEKAGSNAIVEAMQIAMDNGKRVKVLGSKKPIKVSFYNLRDQEAKKREFQKFTKMLADTDSNRISIIGQDEEKLVFGIWCDPTC